MRAALDSRFVRTLGQRSCPVYLVHAPILAVVGTVDEIAPAAGVRAIRQAAPRADVYELCLQAGHFGLVVGSAARTTTWPTVAAWAHWRSGDEDAPENLTLVSDDGATELTPQVRNRVGYGVELASGVGAGIARTTLGTAGRAVRGMRELSREGRLAGVECTIGCGPGDTGKIG